MNKDRTNVTYISPYRIEHKGETHRGIVIGYDSNIGWGEFDIRIDENQNISVHSETRCNDEHKEELELVLDKAKDYIIKKCKIVG